MGHLFILAAGNLEMLLRWPLTIAYLLVMGIVCVYGVHRYWLTLVYYRTRLNMPRPGQRFSELPSVTVQLPMFNEKLVARRIIAAACQIDYPSHKLQIQVLDDSTDESADVARQCAQEMCALGHHVECLHRDNRHGFKAGALNDGMESATGELIAIFDADFVPPRNILKRTVHYFTDADVGMVQTRWEHLNRNDSLLTRCQAIFLDGHFVIEHTARNRSGRWINFNGTAGVWRRSAIESAGNWQHDTLTEDMDLSYRAQLAGWKFIYLPRVTCPAELPPQTCAFKSQQHRWSKGSIQTAKKILPRILRSGAPLRTKIEALFHLTSPMVYLVMVLMSLMFFPVIYLNIKMFVAGDSGWMFGVALLMLATVSSATFYIASQLACHRGLGGILVQLPMLMAIGVGISLNNAQAVLEALLGHESEFVRTPKYDSVGASGSWRGAAARVKLPVKWKLLLLEWLMAAYMVLCIVMAVQMGASAVSVPFLVLFAAGYLYVAITSTSHVYRRLLGQ